MLSPNRWVRVDLKQGEVPGRVRVAWSRNSERREQAIESVEFAFDQAALVDSLSSGGGFASSDWDQLSTLATSLQSKLAFAVANEISLSQFDPEWILTPERPRAIAVFASAFDPRLTCGWAEFLRHLLVRKAGLEDTVVVGAPNSFARRARAIPSPIRLAGGCRFGVDDHELEQVLLDTELHAWYLREPTVRNYTLRIDHQLQTSWLTGRGLPKQEILVTNAEAGRELARRLQSSARAKRRPRLVIILEEPGAPAAEEPLFAVPGVAILVLPVRSWQRVAEDLRWFIEEIVHDQPLHNALHVLSRSLFSDEWTAFLEGASGQILPRLLADPIADHGLRISGALPAILHKSARVYPIAQQADLHGFKTRLKSFVSQEQFGQFENIYNSFQSDAELYRKASAADIDFRGEGLGLLPMSELAQASAKLQDREEEFALQLASLVTDDQFASAFETHQERKVDARLSRRIGANRFESVDPLEPFPPGMPLKLRVHIGQRAKDSLVVHDGPAIDPLLPPLPNETPHELRIVVFPKDFRLDSPAARQVTLPRFGGTAPVDWDLVTPSLRTTEAGDAGSTSTELGRVVELRFSVYYKNYLLQSFRLEAVLGAGVPLSNARYVVINCDYSQTRRFGNLGELPERLASLAVNREMHSPSHTLMFVKDGKHVDIHWTEGQLKTYTEAGRQALFRALAPDGRTTPFAFDPTTMKLQIQAAPTLFANTLRSLADAGETLFNELVLGNSAALPLLQEVRASAGSTLQIARLDLAYAFPWPMIYDYPIPTVPDRSKLPVCSGLDSQGAPCVCGAAPAGYCVRGFWGFRHVIEQLCDAPPPLDNQPGRIAPARTNPLLRVLPAVLDAHVQGWLNRLNGPSQISHALHPTSPDLLSTLRPAGERPIVFAFIGHVKEDQVQGIPTPKLVVKDGVSYVGKSEIVKEILQGRWDSPRSLVLLLACGGEMTRVDTGIGLATSLLQLGAAGVVGAECNVFTGLAARIARDLIDKLSQNYKMGEAMRETQFQLAAEGCPLGLAFTYLGSAELRMPT